MMQAHEFEVWAYQRHDIFCNQKYDDNLPYSQHLKYVKAQCSKYESLLGPNEVYPARCGCAGHDLIEDARVTFNDLEAKMGERIANIIYKCTEERGKDRDERHSIKYYEDLAADEVAIFVKLCDILANVKYGVLTNSSMLKKHAKEHAKTLKYICIERFKPMYEELETLFKSQGYDWRSNQSSESVPSSN